jgi:hypothetical protein
VLLLQQRTFTRYTFLGTFVSSESSVGQRTGDRGTFSAQRIGIEEAPSLFEAGRQLYLFCNDPLRASPTVSALKPCRKAFRREAYFPLVLRGPVLFRALRRFVLFERGHARSGTVSVTLGKRFRVRRFVRTLSGTALSLGCSTGWGTVGSLVARVAFQSLSAIARASMPSLDHHPASSEARWSSR